MKKLLITNKDGYLYTLVLDNIEYKVNIEFYDLEKRPACNDELIISDELFEYLITNRVVNFGLLDNKYGKDADKLVEKDIVILKMEGKTIYLKQVFG